MSLSHGLSVLLGDVTPNAPCIEIKTYPNRRSLSELISQQAPTVCFLDVGSSDVALGVIADLASINSAIPVVAIHTSNDPDLILRCLRQGAREFLFQPFVSDHLSASLERMARKIQEITRHARELAKIYCVIPSKGASGATTLACSLAVQLQRSLSPKDKDKKVLLADLDPTTGTLSFLLKLRSNYSFVDALTHVGHMDDDLWKAIVSNYQGVDVMLSPENPIENFAESQDIAPILDYIREMYASIVIDSRGAYGAWGLM
ncbi:MAG: AAA family ATPase, partial [Bryobacteraceae bacterium]